MVEFKSVAEIPKRPRTALTGHLSQMLAIVSFCGQRSLLLMAFAERRSKCACEGRCPGIERFNAVLLTVQPSPPRSSTCWPSAVCTVDESATCASLFHKCMVRIEAYITRPATGGEQCHIYYCISCKKAPCAPEEYQYQTKTRPAESTAGCSELLGRHHASRCYLRE